MSIIPRLGHPDFMQCRLHLGLNRLRQSRQDIGCLVHPAALMTGIRVTLGQRFPEPKGTVSDRQLGTRCHVKPLNCWTLFCTKFTPPPPGACIRHEPWPEWHSPDIAA